MGSWKTVRCRYLKPANAVLSPRTPSHVLDSQRKVKHRFVTIFVCKTNVLFFFSKMEKYQMLCSLNINCCSIVSRRPAHFPFFKLSSFFLRIFSFIECLWIHFFSIFLSSALIVCFNRSAVNCGSHYSDKQCSRAHSEGPHKTWDMSRLGAEKVWRLILWICFGNIRKS